jgi:hypothetical protein
MEILKMPDVCISKDNLYDLFNVGEANVELDLSGISINKIYVSSAKQKCIVSDILVISKSHAVDLMKDGIIELVTNDTKPISFRVRVK